ncbi:DNA mismatch repair protein Msh3 [Auxenochlorella protothecoides]|uniref:DNA mismatch repair protein MSH3 n=1 Tax=Auxenochlorella protothecoides TaxID=3075 RepID=A0A087SS42_AUXPR|nr:DNA mismatch repair protein Msh3 [Auxenochlorella protothecoides]KFM28546.1 DNA mismatch repair protein Msh3 [Auxenochlorella protothecoides]
MGFGSDEALPAPQETPSKKRNGPDQAVLHDRFQRKLVSGQAATRGERAAEAKQSVTVTGTPPPGAKLTPLEQQVTDLKRQHPGVLLVVECGYKFRFFGEDAETASRILNVFSFPDHNYLVASIPAHRLHVHVRRLVEAGCKVGIVRQTETAAIKAAGTTRSAPFQRRMTELYTRATLEAGELGESACERPGDAPGQPGGSARFLVCVVEAEGAQGRSGGLEVGMVAVETATGAVLFSQFRDSVLRSELEARLLFVPPSEVLGVLRWGAGFQQLNTQAELALSPNTLRQLDVLVNSSTGQEKGSLLWLLNHTRTAFGARRLRHWVSHPLRIAAAITARLDAVQQLREDDCTHAPLAALPGLLRSLPDLEKGLTRALHGTTAPSECVATLCPLLASLLARAGSEAVQAAALEALGPLPAVRGVLGLRALDYVAITNQSDYLIDVPVELVGRVPKDWERVSSVKKSVRYHPPGVKAAIKALELAQEHLAAACQEAWRDWLRAISVNLPLFRSAADALAELDCLLGLATLAGNSGYVRPDILPASPEGGRLAITACRHPMLDVQLGPDFVPNDVALGSGPGGEPRALVLTGPNMGGKSCYIRSAALVAIMAQLGSFVPAQAASLAPF